MNTIHIHDLIVWFWNPNTGRKARDSEKKFRAFLENNQFSPFTGDKKPNVYIRFTNESYLETTKELIKSNKHVDLIVKIAVYPHLYPSLEII